VLQGQVRALEVAILGALLGLRGDPGLGEVHLLGDPLGAVAVPAHRGHVLGQPEVQHPHAPVVPDHHVAGLEIAVQDLVPVGLLEGLPHGQPQANGVVHASALRIQPLAQGLALDVLQRHVGEAVVLAHRVDGHDVGVVEAGGGAGLEEETVEGLLGADGGGMQHLERHLAAQLRVPRQVDLAHAAAVEQPQHPEVVDLLVLQQELAGPAVLRLIFVLGPEPPRLGLDAVRIRHALCRLPDVVRRSGTHATRSPPRSILPQVAPQDPMPQNRRTHAT